MKKPTIKPFLPQTSPESEATKRINLVTTGYNKACDEWEAWLEANKKASKKPVVKLNAEKPATLNSSKSRKIINENRN